ncbi:MAG TPA: hypothetical protein VFV52_02150 [Bacilli bacterium]|nr:hypothetical protein [Bacilli bacterium]
MAGKGSWLANVSLATAVLLSPITVNAAPSGQLSKAEHQQLQELSELSGGTLQVNWDEERGTPSFLSGKLSEKLEGEPYEMALEFLDSVKALYHVKSPKKSFALKKVQQDQLGIRHVRLNHMVRGIPVWGDELIVHIDKTGVVRSVNGEFTPNVEENSEKIGEAQITAQQAIRNALEDVKVPSPDRKPLARLYYFPYPDPDLITLTYVVTVYDMDVPAEWIVFVDAVTGDVVHKYNNIKFKRGEANRDHYGKTKRVEGKTD